MWQISDRLKEAIFSYELLDDLAGYLRSYLKYKYLLEHPEEQNWFFKQDKRNESWLNFYKGNYEWKVNACNNAPEVGLCIKQRDDYRREYHLQFINCKINAPLSMGRKFIMLYYNAEHLDKMIKLKTRYGNHLKPITELLHDEDGILEIFEKGRK